MRSSGAVIAVGVECDAERLWVTLNDGRKIGVPLVWFPRLAGATQSQRDDARLTGNGLGIHWSEIDEDLSVHGLVAEDGFTAHHVAEVDKCKRERADALALLLDATGLWDCGRHTPECGDGEQCTCAFGEWDARVRELLRAMVVGPRAKPAGPYR